MDKYGEGGALANSFGGVSYYCGCGGIATGSRHLWVAYGGSGGYAVGMTPADAPDIADCIVAALSGGSPEALKPKVAEVARRFGTIQFTVD